MATPIPTEASGTWTATEHERFLEAMALYPRGPWRAITEHVGTRSIKQVQTHAQKYQQKLLRHQRGLRKRKTKVVRPEHRVDSSTASQFTNGCIVRKTYRLNLPSSATHSPSSVSTFRSESRSIGFAQPSYSVTPFAMTHAYHNEYAQNALPHAHEYIQIKSEFGHASVPLPYNVEPLPFTHAPEAVCYPQAYPQQLVAPSWDEPETHALMETLQVLLV